MTQEVNFDGLVGPTHSYAGLSHGNLASQRHGQQVSHPRRAALEGLAKMKRLADLGVPQAVLPPHERPDVAALRQLGFTGSDADVLHRAAADAPVLLAACCSASAMWAANAATVSPSGDTADGRVHFTPANLVSQFHRSLEPPTTAAVLRAIFPDASHFAHHPPLPSAAAFADEGAANHTRLCADYGSPGLELFVYGRTAIDPAAPSPRKFPARQTLEASEAIARRHGVRNVLFVQQAPAAIEAGAFHNDVVAVGDRDVLLAHTAALVDWPDVVDDLRTRLPGLTVIGVTDDEVPLQDAVGSYLFNSQLVRVADGSTALIAPAECAEVASTRAFLARLPDRSNGRVSAVHQVDVRQSMRNGGGPACLRLRVVLTDAERAAVHPAMFLTDGLYADLTAWVDRHYREDLAPTDLADPKLLDESRAALDALTTVLRLEPVYPFQR